MKNKAKKVVIEAGMIVALIEPKDRSEAGFMRVTSVRGGKANLGAIFGKRCIYLKGVPVENIMECEDKWYAAWQDSDTYKCM